MEKLIWVIREVKIKANGNNRKRPSSLQKKNEKEKRKRKISKRAVHVTHLNGDEYVFPTLRNHTNLGTQAKRYIQPAGLVPWPDLFNNLRSSRETELFTHFPIHDACAWIGNSHKVALEYYVQTRDEYFSQAANYRTESDVNSDVICGSIAPITTEMHQSAS